MRGTTFKQRITGYAEKSEETLFLFVLFAFFFGFYFIAYSFFPNYSLTKNFISSLGNPILNPKGWFYFSIAEMVMGLFYFIHIRYMYNKLKGNCKKLNYIAVTFGYISTIGTILVALIPENYEDNIGHVFATFITFGGLYISIFFNFFILAGKYKLKKKWPSSIHFIIPYLILYLVAIIYLLRKQLVVLVSPYGIDPKYFSPFFLEWLCLFSIVFWIFSLHFMIPHDLHINNP